MSLTPLPTMTNRVGLMEFFPANADQAQGVITRVRNMGCNMIRPRQSQANNAAEDRSLDIGAYMTAGMDLIMSVNPTAYPTAYPTGNEAAYQAGLGSILDQYLPKLVAIVNEQNSTLYWLQTQADPVQAYLNLLALSKPICAARNIPMCDGGLTSGLLTGMAADWILQGANPVGSQKSAYISQAYPSLSLSARRDLAYSVAKPYAQGLNRALPSVDYVYTLTDISRGGIDAGLRYLHGYLAAGLDALNFHTYTGDTTNIQQIVAMLKAECPGLPLVSNECGVWGDDPKLWSAMLTTVYQNTTGPVIAYTIENPHNRAHGIYYLGTSNPRPAGLAFRGAIAGCSVPIENIADVV